MILLMRALSPEGAAPVILLMRALSPEGAAPVMLFLLVQIKPVVPWKKAEISVTVAKCPPCVHPVSKYCLGEHEVLELPCSESHDYSCGQSCHRVLECGNHTCKRGCHLVINSSTTTSVS